PLIPVSPKFGHVQTGIPGHVRPESSVTIDRNDRSRCSGIPTREANAHSDYQERVINADVGDTVVTRLFGPEWPDQPMRVIVNDGVRQALGREEEALAQAKGQTTGTLAMGGERMPLPRYSAILPMTGFEGDIEQACLTAGQSAGNIDSVMP